MFNLFKKKESKVEKKTGDFFTEMRINFMGSVNFNEWPKGENDVQPWSLFVAARKALSVKNNADAERYLRQITETPGLEPRHYMQAWLFLRYFLKVQPPADVDKKVYAVMVEVCTSTGVMLVVGYADHHARTLHSSGGGVVWENPNNSLNEKIDTLIQAGQQAVNSIPLTVVGIVPTPPKQVDHVLICIATPSGIYQGLGAGEFMSKDQYAGPILNAGTNLLQSLQNLKK